MATKDKNYTQYSIHEMKYKNGQTGAYKFTKRILRNNWVISVSLAIKKILEVVAKKTLSFLNW